MATKEFAWSFSRLNAYETCPKRHYEIDVAKRFKDDEGEALKWGNMVHAAFKKALPTDGIMPASMPTYQKWADAVRSAPGILLVEQKFAITRDFRQTAYFADDVWFRGIGDVVRIWEDVGLVLDWKTGQNIKADSVQLMLMAQCVFSHYPKVKKVRSEFVWLAHDAQTSETYDKDDLRDAWVGLLQRVELFQNAHRMQDFPPKPSGLCRKSCPVNSCPFWGRGARG